MIVYDPTGVNKLTLAEDMDFWCSTDSTTYPIEEKMRNMNFGLSRVTSKIMRFDRNWKHVSDNEEGIPIATQDLVAGQDNYSLETKHAKILRLRIVGRDGKWKTLEPIDRSKITDDLLTDESGEGEFYDKLGYSVMPLPVPDYSVEDGIEIEYQPTGEQFLQTGLDAEGNTVEPGFNPDYHRLVSLEASEDYCAVFNRDRLPAIREAKTELYADLEQYYESRDIDDEASFSIQNNSRATGLLNQRI